MVYEFTFAGYAYDIVSVRDFKDTEAVQKHADDVQRKYNLPYVHIQFRVLA